MDRRKLKTAAIISLSCLMLLTTACASNSKKASEASPSPISTDIAATQGVTQTPAAAADPYGKYDPMIEVHTVRTNILPEDRFKNGDTISNNVWTKEYESALGVKVIYDWVADGATKLDIAIASNDVPDVFSVNAKQLSELVDADQIADLTESYEKFVSPEMKDLANQDGGLALKAATFNGKLMAIPKFGGSITNADVVWVRTDWLKKLNLPEPKTMQDLLKVAEAFVKLDPDGNKKADTFGLTLTKDLSINGFFNGFHAYPSVWIKDPSGKLVYGDIQPEMKTALSKLQEMYKSGMFDKEFGVKDMGKVTESISQNKIGIMYGANWNSYWPLNDARKQNPGMEWKPIAFPSNDDKPAKPGLGFPINDYFVAKKSFKHPEVIVKMLNLQNERFYGKTADWEKYALAKDGTELFQYPLFQVFPPNKDVPDNYDAVKNAFETKDISKLNVEQKVSYDKISAFKNGDDSQWATDRQAGPTDSAFQVLKGYKDSGIEMTEFYGASTPTMVEKKATLDKLELTTFTKIIMGSSSVDEFDTFVASWKKLGGDDMTKEVNDWKAKQK